MEKKSLFRPNEITGYIIGLGLVAVSTISYLDAELILHSLFTAKEVGSINSFLLLASSITGCITIICHLLDVESSLYITERDPSRIFHEQNPFLGEHPSRQDHVSAKSAIHHGLFIAAGIIFPPVGVILSGLSLDAYWSNLKDADLYL